MSRLRRPATEAGATFADLVCFETDPEAGGAARIVTAEADTTATRASATP